MHWSQNRVAMDFSGPDGGRVIEDPHEAEGALIEEAHGWRQRALSNASAHSRSIAAASHAYRPSSIRGAGGGQRWSLAGVEEISPSSSISAGAEHHWEHSRAGAMAENSSSLSASPLSSSPHYLPPHPQRTSKPPLLHHAIGEESTNSSSSSSSHPHPSSSSPFLHPGAAVHLTQPWFHGRIGREEAQDLIRSQGAVDGLFLLRESLSIAGTYVLTLAHDLKIRHFRISTVRPRCLIRLTRFIASNSTFYHPASSTPSTIPDERDAAALLQPGWWANQVYRSHPTGGVLHGKGLILCFSISF